MNLVNNVDKFKGAMTKRPVHRKTHRTTQKHVEHQDATGIQKKTIFCDFRILYFILFLIDIFLNDFSKKC